MSWEERIVGIEELRPYLSNKSTPDFRSLVEGLIEQQQATWPMLRKAVEGLAEVKYKRLSVKGAEVFAQFNPKRIVSTAATVDAATIKRRPCFLCPDNLPPEERGVEFGADFVTLCNPFPVLPRHLVITSRQHIPQSIEGNFGTLLDLARDLGQSFFALYNGPACGASAPDHLHFQACERELPPIFRDLEGWKRQVWSSDSGIEIFAPHGYRLNALIIRGFQRDALVRWFGRALRLLAKTTGAEAEPMVNLVATVNGNEWTVIVFPRSRHRPSCYDAEGDAKLTVSPAAIDLSGALVVPNPSHFDRIGSWEVEKIYAEVTLDQERFDSWLGKLTHKGQSNSDEQHSDSSDQFS
jgi:hypothetical protein